MATEPEILLIRSEAMRVKAVELRRRAPIMRDLEVRRLFYQLAADYERMAEQLMAIASEAMPTRAR